MPEQQRRPTTVEELRRCVALFDSARSVRDELSFRPRPTDVIAAAYPKCGVTWLQQVAHGIRTGGSMDFDEITTAVPWLELAADMGLDPEAPQSAEPRVFKSHLTWREIPKGARYVYIVRDPRDVLVSTYHFYEGWRFETGSIPLPVFARDFFILHTNGRRYWSHLASWWEQRSRSNVLMLCYEDMKEDLPEAVRAVARVMGCPVDGGLFGLVVRQSSIEFMGAHRRQFDDHPLREATNAACGLPAGGDSAKVRTGRVGDYKRELPLDVRDEMDAIWREEIESRFGLPTYGALRARLAEERTV
jgi:hypothetical protein